MAITALDDATAITIETRRALSELNSDYIRRMGSLGYHRVRVGEEHCTYYWSSKVKSTTVRFFDMLDSEAIRCPFQ